MVGFLLITVIKNTDMEGQEFFFWGLKISDAMTMSLSSRMTVIALGIGAICFICNLAYNYLHHSVSMLVSPDEDKFPDIMEIARCIALFFCLTAYTPIVKTVVGTLEVINQATSLATKEEGNFEEYTGLAIKAQSDMLTNYEEHSLQSGISSGDDKYGAMQKELENIKKDNKVSGLIANLKSAVQFLNPVNAFTLTLHAAAVLLIGIIQVIILGISVIILKVLVVFGPLAIAVSILPAFEKQINKWFGTLCTVGIVFSVINVLNLIVAEAWKNIYNVDNFNLTDELTKPLQFLAMDIVIIGVYCCCFWLAGILVGHGDAGRIISKTVGIVTAAATMAITGGTIAGGATNVGAAASLGKSLLNDE